MSAIRGCINCGRRSTCSYRGIINPCDDWVTNLDTRVRQLQVQVCRHKRMSLWERQFINSCTGRQVYTPKQTVIIDQIFSR
jgi:hypothetical protein